MSTNTERYYQRYGLTHPARVVSRVAGEQIRLHAARYLRGRLLEIGCGTKAKSLLVGEYVDEYVGLDIPTGPHDASSVDVFATAYFIPFADGSFDSVLSTAVLEHLEEPGWAIGEAYRVLKPGGYGLYTAPLFWHLHEQPRDFYRYTRFGLDYLFTRAGFEVVELLPLAGFVTTFGTELSYYLQRFRRGPLAPVVDGVVALNNLLLPRLDRGALRAPHFSWMSLVVARRPL